MGGVRGRREGLEGPVIRGFALSSLLVLGAGCASGPAGWGTRGRYWKLDETPELEVRRGPQVVDRATKDRVLQWVGVRTGEGRPPLLACELTVFEDRNGNGTADPGEVLSQRENLARTRQVLFDEVRVPAAVRGAVRLRLSARTEEGTREILWSLLPD